MTEYEKGYHANAHCCYYATVEEFLKESKKSWLACMENQFLHVYKGMQSGDGEKEVMDHGVILLINFVVTS